MKKLLMMTVMSFTLPMCFSNTLEIPVGNGEFKTLGEDGDGYWYSLEDANNDGYPDIVEGNYEWTSDYGGTYSRLYMYNPKTRKFEKAEHDGSEELNDGFSNLRINGDGTITTMCSMRTGSFPVAEYKWTGSKWHCYKKYDF